MRTSSICTVSSNSFQKCYPRYQREQHGSTGNSRKSSKLLTSVANPVSSDAHHGSLKPHSISGVTGYVLNLRIFYGAPNSSTIPSAAAAASSSWDRLTDPSNRPVSTPRSQRESLLATCTNEVDAKL